MKKKLLSAVIGGLLCAPLMAVAAPQDQPIDDVLGMADAQVDVRTEPVGQLPTDDAPAAAPAGSGLLAGARFSLTQEFSGRLGSQRSVTNNRSVFRAEYEKHFLDNFYAHVDLLETAFWGNDHRARSQDAELYSETTVRDAYLQFSKADTSVKLGNQILIWGESDAGAITDVISPRDLSELFFVSLEKSRRSQFMLTVDQFSTFGDWGFFYVPRPKFNRYPDAGDVYAVDPFGGSEETRTASENKGEFGLRWKKTFGRSDFSVMAARLTDNDYAVHQSGLTSDGRLILQQEPLRQTMVGATFNLAGKGFLVSGEFARKSPKAFIDTTTLAAVHKDQVDSSLRVEYALGNGGSHAVSLEVVNNHVLGWSPEVAPVRRDTNTLVLGWRNTFLHDNLSVNWITVYNHTQTGFTHSLFMDYKLNDRVELSLDAFYLSVKDQGNPLYPYKGLNSMVFRFTYHF